MYDKPINVYLKMIDLELLFGEYETRGIKESFKNKESSRAKIMESTLFNDFYWSIGVYI